MNRTRTTMKTIHIPIVILACCALFAAAGCKEKTSDAKTELTASSGGRDIHVIAEGGAWVGPKEDQFTVKVGGHEIVIGTAQVLVDKKESAKVPAGAKKFEVKYEGGTLTIGADGAEILKTAPAK